MWKPEIVLANSIPEFLLGYDAVESGIFAFYRRMKSEEDFWPYLQRVLPVPPRQPQIHSLGACERVFVFEEELK